MSLLRRLERRARAWVATAVFELRRTRRVIVPPNHQPSGEPPIFIIGVHRSGTTLLRLILDSHSRIACPPESFFIRTLAELTKDRKSMEGLTAMGFNEMHVHQRIRELVSYFFEMYVASRGKTRWADKTPTYVDILEFIEALYGPNARYIMIYRHGLDVACSIADMRLPQALAYVEACGGDYFAGAARYWAVQCQKMLNFQATHARSCLEVRYEMLTQDPEIQVPRIFKFLSENWEPQVLRFYELPHDHWIGLQDSKSADSKGFEPHIGTWRTKSRETIQRMLQEAGPMLQKLGYETPEAHP